MTDPVDPNELERLERAATPGPWRGSTTERRWSVSGAHREPILEAPKDHQPLLADALLLVTARNALPALIAEVRELRSARDRAILAIDHAIRDGRDHPDMNSWMDRYAPGWRER